MSLLGIDIGTTGTKAVAFNEEGKEIANGYLEYNLIFPRPGWVEFNTDEIWEKIFNVIKIVNNNEKVKKDPVVGLSVSTIGESFAPVSMEGDILYNTIYSTDSRGLKESDYIYNKISKKELYNITGYPPGFISPLNKILWIKNEMPKIYKKTKKFLFTEDFLYHKLGIEDTKISHSLCSGTLFFDIREKKWSSKILNILDIDENLFSEPVLSGEIIGDIKKEIAEELGFRKRVSIISGGHDQQCAALGSGAFGNGIAADSMGTVECITIPMNRLLVNDYMYSNNYSNQIHVIDGMNTVLAANLSSGSILKWYRDLFYKDKRGLERNKSFYNNIW